MTRIEGKTYPIRRELRALGGQWDTAAQCWYVPDERAAEARGLLDVGRARSNASRRRGSSSHGPLHKIGGGRGYLGTDERGHAHFGRACGCEDYPCCGH